MEYVMKNNVIVEMALMALLVKTMEDKYMNLVIPLCNSYITCLVLMFLDY
jgi:hypothetical protein